MLTKVLVADVGEITKVVTSESLCRQTCYHIPTTILVIGIQMQTIGVLCQTLLAHEVRSVATILGHIVQSKLTCTLVLIAKLVIIAIAIGIAQGSRSAPAVVDAPSHGEYVVVLPEIVRCPVPQTTVALGISLRCPCRGIVPILYETLIKTIEPTQPHAIEVLVGAHTAIGIQAVVVITSHHTIPCLTCTLEITQVSIPEHQPAIFAQPCHTCRIVSALAVRAMQIAIRCGLIICSVHHPMLAEKTCGELSSHAPCVVHTITSRQLQHGGLLWQFRLHGYATAEGTITVATASHTALDLHTSEQRCIGVHIGPKDALVLGRVQWHTIQRYVHSASGTSSHTHVHGSCTQSVLAPRHYSRRTRKEVW